MQSSNMQMQGLSPKLRNIVEGELAPDESVQWLDRPIPSLLARKAWPIVLFGIPWTAFAIFWVAGASGFKMPDFRNGFGFFPLFGIPFILIGLGMLSSPFWIRRRGEHTAYVLTSRRAIIVNGGLFSTKVRSFAPASLGDIERKQRPDGAGDIIFTRQFYGGPYSGGAQPGLAVGFLAVANVQAVEDMIRAMVAAAAKSPPS